MPRVELARLNAGVLVLDGRLYEREIGQTNLNVRAAGGAAQQAIYCIFHLQSILCICRIQDIYCFYHLHAGYCFSRLSEVDHGLPC